jgi:hemolysin activation/secretion protein
VIRREKRVGMLALVSYPFSKFTRLEGSFLLRHASEHRLQNGDFQDVDLVSNFLALIQDNTRWTWLGPSGGWRFFLAGGFTRDLTSGAGDFGTVLGEVRHYAQPLPGLVAATRVQGQASLGRDAQRFFLGGPFTLRGYPRRSLAGPRTLLVSHEQRFPLLRGLTLGVPTTWVFPTVSGALLADVAWAEEDEVVAHLGGAGFGVYLGGGYFPAIRWNFVWRTQDFRDFSRHPVTQFSLMFNY